MAIQSAVIGAGNSAQNGNMPALARNPRTNLVAICDLDEERAADVAGEFGIHSYVDLNDMLNAEDLDWVHICTPVQTHYDLASTLLNSGINVLIQKPITETTTQVEELVGLAQSNNVRVSAVHNRAFIPIVRRVQEEIESGEFGEIEGISTLLSEETPPDETPRGSWVFDLPGGEFEEGFPHGIYLALALGGYPKNTDSIQATSRRKGDYNKNIAYDGVQVQYINESDTVCNIKFLSASVPLETIEITGSKKSARIDLTTMNYIEHDGSDFSPISMVTGNIKTSIYPLESLARNILEFGETLLNNKLDRHDGDSASGTYYQINEEVKAIEEGSSAPVPAEEAVWTMKIMDAIRDSAQ